jgi:hypothetical protein
MSDAILLKTMATLVIEKNYLLFYANFFTKTKNATVRCTKKLNYSFVGVLSA